MTNILLAPIYPPVLLGKTAASIDQLSGGRFTLGLAPGGRPDDYEVTGRDFHRRGRDFDHALEVMHQVWRGDALAEGSHQQAQRQRTMSAYPFWSAAIVTRPSNACSRGGTAGLLEARLPRKALRTPRRYATPGPAPVAAANHALPHSPTFHSARMPRRRLGSTSSTTTASSATMGR